MPCWGAGGAIVLTAVVVAIFVVRQRLDAPIPEHGRSETEMIPFSYVLNEQCCREATAECRACAVGESVEEFCAIRAGASAAALGCEKDATKCCDDPLSAACLACAADQQLSAFCKSKNKTNADLVESLPGCDCHAVDQDIMYIGGDLYNAPDVHSAEDCCYRCNEEPKCTGWTFSSPATCAIKSQIQIKRQRLPGHASGLRGGKAPSVQLKLANGICLSTLHNMLELFLAKCDNWGQDTRQLFDYDPASGFITDQAGLCIDAGDNRTLGARVWLRECSDVNATMQWEYLTDQMLRNRAANLCLGSTVLDDMGSHIFLMDCRASGDQVQWDMWIITPVAAALTQRPPQAKNNISGKSVYCVAAMLPWGNELQLLRWQYQKGVGIFTCEDYDVYSNVVLDLGGFATRMVYTDMHCQYGLTVTNTPVFTHLWNQIATDGEFLKHDWIVKVDPDTMFIPSRLHKNILREINDTDANGNDTKGMYLSDCSTGMHGPIEPLSRQALSTLQQNINHCQSFPQEDVYLRVCLDRNLVKSQLHVDLLGEMHCHFGGWHECTAPRVAFHPFKSIEEWEGCQKRALDAHPPIFTSPIFT